MFRSQTNMSKIVLFLLAVLLLVVANILPRANAATVKELQQRSQTLQAEIDGNNKKITKLAKKADTLQGKIKQLNAEIASATAEIELTQVKLDELRQRLAETEAELERQKGLLKAALRALYERRDASTVEMLVASDSFSDFINEQEYLTRLQTAVKDSADKVIELKQQIETEKAEQEKLLAEQQEQKSLLAAKRAEQKEILEKTEGQEGKYRKLVAGQMAELEKAERQLAALLSSGAVQSLGPVYRGQQIGRVGSTGYSTGPHVHFQVYHNGVTQNPYAGGGSLVRNYLWPLPGSQGSGNITQSYGCVAAPWYYAVKCNGGRNSFHNGLDIRGNAYDRIVAAADGEIIFRGCKGGLGYVVVISHGGGWQTWYPHQTTPGGQVYGYC